MTKPNTRRLSVELLETREVPAGNVVTVVHGSTLFLVGDSQANTIILSQPGGPGTLRITPTGTTTVNGFNTPVNGTLSPNLDIQLGTGDDSISFDLGTSPFVVQNALTIDYFGTGVGTKTTQTTGAAANDLTVGGNLGLRYAAGNVTTTLDNLQVTGGLTVLHATGDGTLTVDNKHAGGAFSKIGGSVVVTSTQGVANNTILDTNIGGNVTITNGKARTSDNAAGSTNIAVANNTTLATIGGSMTVSNVSGDNAVGDAIADVHVKGNVILALGSGVFTGSVTKQAVSSAPTIDGMLRITASANGSASMHLGSPGVGLVVKQSLTLRSGNRAAVVTLDDVSVTTSTSIFTGQGNDTLTIDGATGDAGSTFTGGFNLGTGPGTDTLSINSGSAAAATTTFKGAFSASLGAGNDTLNLATAGIVNFPNRIPTFNGSLGINTKNVTTGHLSGMAPKFLNFA
jgi:hypothetical protein